ncbi:right-handed parallel beta-helix repeat-containing protein [Microvirga arabica]|uniref:Right-handed parallel beta-helix repeat-containing protein n=1 Tax=Microvirga arabica TaxID=1128671 RepID=A0ABV6Y4W2_9HYPH
MATQIINVAPPTGDATRDTAAIKEAIQRANAAYQDAIKLNPSAEQVTVQLAVGTYVVTGDPSNPSVGAVELLSGVALVGVGMGQTVLQLTDNFNARLNGIVRTDLNQTVQHVTLANLTIDGNRANNTDHQAGFISGVKANEGVTHSDITISGVEVRNATGYGFNPHEITTNITIENSVAHHNRLDGFVADGVEGGVYRNNLSYANERHGFNIQNATTNLVLENNEAYGNGSGATGGAGITVQRGDIPRDGETTIGWVSNIQIIGGEYYSNSREGILVKLSDNVTIDGASVHDNMRQGVRIEGSTDTILRNSEIFNNAQGQTATVRYDEVQIRLRNDFPDGNLDNNPATVPAIDYYSTNTQILNNVIYSNGAIDARYGIREEITNTNGGSTGTQVSGNIIFGLSSGPTSVPGYTYTPGASADARPLVDDQFYLSRYPDVKAAGIDPDDHYAAFGWQEGRNPNAFFNTNAYLSANQDVDAANINPLEHYHQNGWKEGRDASVSFDTTLYLINNADVKAAGIDPLEHYLANGRAEGRQAYAAVGQNLQGTFDAEYYLLANPDVGLADVDAAFHFQNYGWKEGRDPNAFFDTTAYLTTYADVAAAGINPLEHYNAFGWKEGRDPAGSFDTSSYLATYTDVAAANINPLEHYLKFGVYEGRSAFGDSVIG